MSWQRVVLILGGLFFIFVIWLGRYDLVAVPAGGQGSFGIVYRLDRWTGHIIAIHGDEEIEIKKEKHVPRK